MSIAPLVCVLLGLSSKVALPPGALVRYGDPFAVPNGSPVSLSADGRYLAVSQIGLIVDTKTGRRFLVPCEENESVAGCSFAGEGTLLVWGAPHVRLFNLDSGECTFSLQVASRSNLTPMSVSTSADGRTFAIVWGQGNAFLAQVTVHRADGPADGIELPIKSYTAAMSPDGRLVATVESTAREVSLFDATDAKLRRTYSPPAVALNSWGPVYFARDSRSVYAHFNGRLSRYSFGGDAEVQTSESDVVVPSVAMGLEGTLSAGLVSGQIATWNASTLKLVRSRTVPSLPGRRPGAVLAISADGNTLTARASGGPIEIWDLTTRRLRHQVPSQWPTGAVALTGDAALLYAYRQNDGMAYEYGRFDGKLRASEPSNWGQFTMGRVRGEKYFPDWSDGAKTAIRDAKTNAIVEEIPASPTGQAMPDFRGDRCFASVGHQVIVRDLGTRQPLYTIADTAGCPLGFPHVTRDNRSIVVARGGVPNAAAPNSKAGTIAVYELATRTLRREIAPAFRMLNNYVIGSDRSGNTIAVNGFPGALVIDLQFGKSIFADAAGTIAAISGDGRWLVLTSNELVDLRSIDLARIRFPCEPELSAAAFAPDSRQVLTGYTDGTALLWDVAALERRFDRPKAPQSRQEFWELLGSPDAAKAEIAFQYWTSNPTEAVLWARTRLAPAEPIDPDEIAKWIDNLDSPQFELRQAASRELSGSAERAAPTLRATVRKTASVERRQRAEDLLGQLENRVKSPERLKAIRGVELMERLGTPEAFAVLKWLATGAEDANLTADAKSAIGRLSP